MPLSQTELQEIKARVEGATPGPWTESAGSMGNIHIGPDADYKGYERAVVIGDDERRNAWNDALFIAHARTDLPRLIEAYEEQDEEILRLRKKANKLMTEINIVAGRVVYSWEEFEEEDQQIKLRDL